MVSFQVTARNTIIHLACIAGALHTEQYLLNKNLISSTLDEPLILENVIIYGVFIHRGGIFFCNPGSQLPGAVRYEDIPE